MTKAAKGNPKSKCIIYIIIVILLLLTLIAAILISTLRHKINDHSHNSVPSTTKVPAAEIQLACQATRHPETCQSSLLQSNLVPANPTPPQIIQSALLISSQNIKSSESKIKSLLESAGDNINITNVAKSCSNLMSYSQYRISLSNESLPLGKTKHARAWMSAALAYQYDCYGGLSYHGGNTQAVNDTILVINSSIALTSNALNMVVSYDLFGNETKSWRPPKTERDEFWEGPALGSQTGFTGESPSKLKADVTVSKDGSGGSYKTVQEAVNAAPSNAVDRRFVIHIKEGVYEEIVRVPFEKKNVVFLGDGMGKTVITGSVSVGQVGVTTYESATVGVLGDGFMASGLTFQNTAGAPTHQAVAFRSDSDLSFIENCEFIGHQDTLYAHSLRQFYKSCRIEGNVDFIFGNSAAIFQDCEIVVNPRQEKPEKGENNAVTAHGRTDPAQATGFVFQNCLINGTEEYMALFHSKPGAHKNYLGRPWKEYSRVVFIHCNFEAIITPEGWMPWTGDFALKTLYYGEFENSGPGSNLSGRVKWSSQIPAEHVYTYSVQNFIQGDEWIPTSS
ncbi:probable pectinesterase/pectinesterase inhibitor 51 isoform X2 [Ricinus communis]|uniref:probable pectinesterase/pectinesterase inhibitor 51 isoform X2 n=1 Tax=Ricinus communis TaxID=3988 RepID=UPI000772671F|nr:probable pectinesterase/pectinesterase inhibitor 51 isoform X2 [Ricinus communis]|eukprot:XP_015573562.1 probable pectinesterase/pectinesterase inhibitor 51 isoform X2 [Ricinus communis]